MFTLDGKTCIDGSVAWNLARYANHSCSPNCKTIKKNGGIWLNAVRNIEKGEEITYNYGYDVKNYTDNPCNCGSPNCAGFMVTERHMETIK